jgi:hypothetical protein
MEDKEDVTAAKSLVIQGSNVSQPSPIFKQPSRPKSDIDILTQQLEQLKINQAQIYNALQTLSARSSGNNANGRCFICGQTGTHPLHPRNCPETKNLLNEGLIKFDAERRRYTLLDGSDLPVLPASSQGVATHLRQQAGKTASTSSISLLLGNSQALGGQLIGITAEEYNEYIGQPATRSGKDTSVHIDPYKRPEPKEKPVQRLPGIS